jgi:anthranilate synthase component II
MKLLLIDNYDSFTFNLYHDFGRLGAKIDVVRNDSLSVDDVRSRAPDAIILSPGPCTPSEAGICLDVIAALGTTIPMFGVCLGLQAIGQAFGGDVIRAPLPVHGKLGTIQHNRDSLFQGINGPFKATRYHSLIVDRATLPQCLTITAETDGGLIMGLSHISHPIHAVQFHPESISSEYGLVIMKNFLNLANAWNQGPRMALQSSIIQPFSLD